MTKRPNVLVVEDNYFIGLDMADMVERAGGKAIGPASTTEHAISLVQSVRIDGALLDIVLQNRETVYPVALELRKRDVPYAFVTGLPRSGIASEFADAELIAKPISDADVERWVSLLQVAR